jgi:c-di-GMP-binding flagellar brake protein YcgR
MNQDDINKIKGNSIKKVFEDLIKDKIFIRIRLIEGDYQRLTLMTGIRKKLRYPVFQIDYPQGFKEAVAGSSNWKAEIEFTGNDNLKYSFIASGGQIAQDEIRIRFPRSIHRHQRRKHFRLEAPDGTTFAFNVKANVCREKVIDISLGGVMIALVYPGDKDPNGLPFRIGDVLQDVELVFPYETGDHRIDIKKAAVVRIEDGTSGPQKYCGLQFIEIEKDQIKTLTEFIYNYQRRVLRKRLRADV